MPSAVSLFAGIGGLDLALEAHGFQVIAQVENDPYCQAVLTRHWPTVPRYGDIREVDWDAFRAEHGTPDLVAAGFPCQPVSSAGRRKAQEDPRWLWPEVARCARQLRPRYLFVENTTGLLVRGFGDVLRDLAALGFDAEWDCFKAADVGAPHERDRVFLLAHRSWAGGRRPRLGTADAGQAGRDDVADANDGQPHQRQGAEPASDQRPAAGWGELWAGGRGGDVAHPNGEHGTAGERERPAVGRAQLNRASGAGGGGRVVADTDGAGWGEHGGAEPVRAQQPAVECGGNNVAHPAGPGRGAEGSASGQGGRSGSARRLQLGRLGGGNGQQGDAQPRVGGDVDGLPAGLDGHCWPAPPGPEQYPWEPPRTVGKGIPNRGKRVSRLGNAVVPQQGALAFGILWQRMLDATA